LKLKEFGDITPEYNECLGMLTFKLKALGDQQKLEEALL
jgi:hypothetical protein